MEEINKVERLLEHIEEYGETRLDILVLSMQDKLSNVLSSIASILILGILTMFFLLFVSVSTAWWIGEILHSPSMGFLSVAGFYFLVVLVIYLNREKWIKLPIINALIKKINFHEEN